MSRGSPPSWRQEQVCSVLAPHSCRPHGVLRWRLFKTISSSQVLLTLKNNPRHSINENRPAKGQATVAFYWVNQDSAKQVRFTTRNILTRQTLGTGLRFDPNFIFHGLFKMILSCSKQGPPKAVNSPEFFSDWSITDVSDQTVFLESSGNGVMENLCIEPQKWVGCDHDDCLTVEWVIGCISSVWRLHRIPIHSS